MINWERLIANSSWVLGLAIILADLSYRYWLAGEEKQPLRRMWHGFSERLTTWVALGLIAAGLAGTSATMWESALWLGFLLVALYYVVKSWRTKYRT